MTPQDARPSPEFDPARDPAPWPEATPAAALRQRAEALAAEKDCETPESPDALSREQAHRALHELRVHEIELEMQNEELRGTQEQLEISRARYFDLYDLAPVGYFTLSEHGLILEANLTGAKLLGVTRRALVNRPLSGFILPEDQDIYFQSRRRLLETGAPQVWELRLLKTGAAPFWVRIEATTAENADGASGWRAVVSDITESKRAERTLKTTNAELEEFAYALTHDLQEPLRMVVNFSQLLKLEQGGRLGDDADQYLSFTVDGALKIERLVKDLLAYWEVTERGGDRFSAVDCNDLLSHALLTLQTSIQQSGAMVTSDSLPTVTANEMMLTQVFQNLIANSIKYRGTATPQIHISVMRITEGWLFSVTDNGIGIEPAFRERVFGMFRRLHGNEVPGTGIGLALCRKVVERHGGRIWVESEAGAGAVFKFTLPTGGLP